MTLFDTVFRYVVLPITGLGAFAALCREVGKAWEDFKQGEAGWRW